MFCQVSSCGLSFSARVKYLVAGAIVATLNLANLFNIAHVLKRFAEKLARIVQTQLTLFEARTDAECFRTRNEDRVLRK